MNKEEMAYYPEDFDPETDEVYKGSIGYAFFEVHNAWVKTLHEATKVAALSIRDFEIAMRILRNDIWRLAEEAEKEKCVFDE